MYAIQGAINSNVAMWEYLFGVWSHPLPHPLQVRFKILLGLDLLIMLGSLSVILILIQRPTYSGCPNMFNTKIKVHWVMIDLSRP